MSKWFLWIHFFLSARGSQKVGYDIRIRKRTQRRSMIEPYEALWCETVPQNQSQRDGFHICCITSDEPVNCIDWRSASGTTDNRFPWFHRYPIVITVILHTLYLPALKKTSFFFQNKKEGKHIPPFLPVWVIHIVTDTDITVLNISSLAIRSLLE